jgi:hypothetical protein
VLRRICGPKREEDGPWRKLHSGQLHSLYSSSNIVRLIKSRRMRWAGRLASMGEGKGVYRISVRGPGGKRPLRKPRHMWEDNIKMGLREVEIELDSFGSEYDLVAGFCEHGNETSSSVKRADCSLRS